MTDTQRLQDKRTDLRLTGLLQQLDTTLEQAMQSNLNVVATRPLLADLELEPRWHNAIHLRWRQSARTETLTLDQCDFDHHTSRQEQKTRLLTLFTLDCIAATAPSGASRVAPRRAVPPVPDEPATPIAGRYHGHGHDQPSERGGGPTTRCSNWLHHYATGLAGL